MRCDRLLCKTELGYNKMSGNLDVIVRENGSAGVMRRGGLGKSLGFPHFKFQMLLENNGKLEKWEDPGTKRW